MSTAKAGDIVNIHYTGTLDDGTQFDSSQGRDPLQFTLESGKVIAGFEVAVDGMSVGESKTVKIPAEQAYGVHQEEMVHQVPRSDIHEHIQIEKGVQLQTGQPGGQPIVVTVVAFDDETVTLDGNHALAGQALTFALELVSIG
ncbi:MAG: FKBP-type peptidyl-prolyl cis-trans isomerase [Proteobacteria bacterium]|nr:FKBP-type peptidyl-prolyl cis-trans isomerase [Pseudomonadota bacterium]